MVKKKRRIKSKIGYKKNLLVILYLILLAVFVIAATPSVPTVLSPANQTTFYNNAINLTCSGSTGTHVEFNLDDTIVQSTTAKNYSAASLDYVTHNWTCRAYNQVENIQANNLTVYYSFDENSGTLDDDTGNGWDGTISGVTYQAGHVGAGSYYFTTNDYMETSNPNEDPLYYIDSISNNWSMNVWIKVHDETEGEMDLIGTWNDNAGNVGWSLRKDNGNNNGRFIQYDGGYDFNIVQSDLFDNNNWTMVTITRAGNDFKLYKNGTIINDTITIGTDIKNPSLDFRYGRTLNVNKVSFDDTGFWDTTLNAGNISDLWNNTFGKNALSREYSDYIDDRVFSMFNMSEKDGGNALRLIFKNESNSENILGSLVSLSFDFDTDDNDLYDFSFTNSTSKENWTFQLNPQETIVDINGSVSFKGSGFPQRTTTIDETLNGSLITNVTLYLLPTVDGIYVTFQVVDSSNAVVSGATVTVSKIIGGTLTEISSGDTDASGGITLWLDPNSQHTISASKTGVGSTSFSLTPTQSSYTITLSGVTLINQTSSFLGITFDTNPDDLILNNNTNYNFTFDINSSHWNLTSWGFNLRNSTSSIVSTSNNSVSGGLLRELLDTDDHDEINMDYWWNIDGNYTNLTRTWNVVSTYTGDLSIKNFFNDFASYAAVGFGAGYNSFGGIIISLAILVVVVGGLSLAFGIYSPLGIMGLSFAVIFLLETVNILPPLIRKYLLTAILGIILVAYFIKEQST